MTGFLTPCDLRIAANTDNGKYELLANFVYQSDEAGMTITVPKGFTTDLASVPRMPLIFLLCGDTSREAAVLHDWLYFSGRLSRKLADKLLFEASGISGVANWRRWLMYFGVRIGGAKHYSGLLT